MSVKIGPGHPAFPGTPDELDEPALLLEDAYRVEGARVALIDVEALTFDFPEVAARAESGSENPEEFWCQWLLEQAALVSGAQAEQTEVNTPIRVTREEPREVYRLPRGGRAFLAPVRDDVARGMLSLKGVGVGRGVVPRGGFYVYQNGLLRLDDAICEVLFQRLVEQVLPYIPDAPSTLPIYGVIEFGFRIVDAEKGSAPAGVLVRRAHRRPRGGVDHPRFGGRLQRVSLDLELALRRFGVTSTSPAGVFVLTRSEVGKAGFHYYDLGELQQGGCPQPVADGMWKRFDRYADETGSRVIIEGVNIQSTRDEEDLPLQLLDFGGFRVCERFAAPLLSMVINRESNWGGVIVPDSPHFVQPDSDIELPSQFWRLAPHGTHDPEDLRQFLGSLDLEEPQIDPEELTVPVEVLVSRLAEGFHAGSLSRQEVTAAVGRAIHRCTHHLEKARETGG